MSPTRALLTALLMVTASVDTVFGQSSSGTGSSVISDCVTLCYTGVINQDGCSASDLRCHCENSDSIIAEMPRCVATRPECRNQDPTVFTDAVSMYCQRIMASSFASTVRSEEMTSISPLPSSVVSVTLFPTTLTDLTGPMTAFSETLTLSEPEPSTSIPASGIVSHVSSSPKSIPAPISGLLASYPVIVPAPESSVIVEPTQTSYSLSLSELVTALLPTSSYGMTSVLVSTLLNSSTSATRASNLTTSRVPLANSTLCTTSSTSFNSVSGVSVPTLSSSNTCMNNTATGIPTRFSTRSVPLANATVSLPMGPGPAINPTACLGRCPGNATSPCFCPSMTQPTSTITTTLTVSALPCTEMVLSTDSNSNSGGTSVVTTGHGTNIGHLTISDGSTFTFTPSNPSSIVAIFTGTGFMTSGYQSTGVGSGVTINPTGCGSGPIPCHPTTLGTGEGNGGGGEGGTASPNTTSSYFAGSLTAPVVGGGAPLVDGGFEDLIYLLAAYLLFV